MPPEQDRVEVEWNPGLRIVTVRNTASQAEVDFSEEAWDAFLAERSAAPDVPYGEAEARAEMETESAEATGGIRNPTPDCGAGKPPGADEPWWCPDGRCDEFHATGQLTEATDAN